MFIRKCSCYYRQSAVVLFKGSLMYTALRNTEFKQLTPLQLSRNFSTTSIKANIIVSKESSDSGNVESKDLTQSVHNLPNDDVIIRNNSMGFLSVGQNQCHEKGNNKNTAKRNVLDKIRIYIEDASRIEDLRKAQQRVMALKDELKESGDYKRALLRDLSSVRSDIQKNHTEQCNAGRGTERYVHLVQLEHEHLQKEKQREIDLSVADERERSLFNALTVAINDSYEKEKIHSNLIKVWGVVATLMSSIFTLIISLIGYIYHNIKYSSLTDFEKNNSKVLKELNSIKSDTSHLISKVFREKGPPPSVESWGSYLKRHTRWTYGWAMPKK